MKVRMSETDLPIRVRPLQSSDINFVRSSWLKTLHQQDPFKHIPFEVFKTEVIDMIDEMIAEGFTQVICHEDIEDEIMTYMNYKRHKDFLMLNFIYTKKPYRKLGLAKFILDRVMKSAGDDLSIFYTTHTMGAYWLRSKRMIYNPFLLWKPL